MLPYSSLYSAYFIKNLFWRRRKASSALRDEEAGNLFLIKVQSCLHYKGFSGVYTGWLGRLWKGSDSILLSKKHGNIFKEQCLHHGMKLVLWNDLMCLSNHTVIQNNLWTHTLPTAGWQTIYSPQLWFVVGSRHWTIQAPPQEKNVKCRWFT